MKRILLYVPIVLSLVILAAHFLRYGNAFGVAGVVVLVVLLWVRRPFAARALQLALILGAAEWGYTLYRLAQFRAAMDLPATRMVIILGAVVALTFCSALLFETAELRKAYRLER
ncbi:MAG: hypothetical protein P8X98_03325 [Woeseiaceae bacterium]|jgi:hypothetical protein